MRDQEHLNESQKKALNELLEKNNQCFEGICRHYVNEEVDFDLEPDRKQRH